MPEQIMKNHPRWGGLPYRVPCVFVFSIDISQSVLDSSIDDWIEKDPIDF